VDPKVNDNFLLWLIGEYTSNQIGEIKAVREMMHDYLTMTLTFLLPEVVKVDTTQYVNQILKDFPEKLSGQTKCLMSENFFKVDKTSSKLLHDKTKIFHTYLCHKKNVLLQVCFARCVARHCIFCIKSTRA
jgi:hypothetical protein